MPREKNCAICGKLIFVKPSLYERTKYCSVPCRNIGWRGQHRSRKTEFKKGDNQREQYPVGTIRTRFRKRGGKLQKFIKVAEPNKWALHCRYVWEQAYGPIPQGLLIHHMDRNTLNDSLSNLALVSRAWHLKEHRPEFEGKRKRGIAKRKQKVNEDE